MIVTPIEMYSYLREVEYPVHKEEVMQIAKNNGAYRDVLGMLAEIRDGEYHSLPDLMSEIEYQELFRDELDAGDDSDVDNEDLYTEYDEEW